VAPRFSRMVLDWGDEGFHALLIVGSLVGNWIQPKMIDARLQNLLEAPVRRQRRS